VSDRNYGFFERESRWLAVLTVVVPLLGLIALVAIPRLFR
jgi:hypothetical protein